MCVGGGASGCCWLSDLSSFNKEQSFFLFCEGNNCYVTLAGAAGRWRAPGKTDWNIHQILSNLLFLHTSFTMTIPVFNWRKKNTECSSETNPSTVSSSEMWTDAAHALTQVTLTCLSFSWWNNVSSTGYVDELHNQCFAFLLLELGGTARGNLTYLSSFIFPQFLSIFNKSLFIGPKWNVDKGQGLPACRHSAWKEQLSRWNDSMRPWWKR